MHNPTTLNYNVMTEAYNFFNENLFENSLPDCLITFQRKANTYGYFAFKRFSSHDNNETTDEIALNPATFKNRSTAETLSTLVHEMAHLWQYHLGTPAKSRYHNSQWANMMESLGLMPSDTSAPGGKRTGTRMSHYIIPGGRFDIACAELLSRGFSVPYRDAWAEHDPYKKTKLASKTKFTCPSCRANAWARAAINLVCGDCDMEMLPPGAPMPWDTTVSEPTAVKKYHFRAMRTALNQLTVGTPEWHEGMSVRLQYTYERLEDMCIEPLTEVVRELLECEPWHHVPLDKPAGDPAAYFAGVTGQHPTVLLDVMKHYDLELAKDFWIKVLADC